MVIPFSESNIAIAGTVSFLDMEGSGFDNIFATTVF